MSEPSRPNARAAVAGSLLVATIVLCAGVGAAIGALVGALVPLLLVGLFVGPILGVMIVRSRFRDL